MYIYFASMSAHFMEVLKEYRHLVVILLSAIAVRYLIVSFYKKRKALKKADKFIIGINNLSIIFFGVWMFFLVLHLVGITVKEFFTSITIIAAALAIVFREYILNGLNGMIIMFGDNFEIGDYIEVNNQKGYIKDLTLLHVHLKNDEYNRVLIPNNLIASSNVINYSKNPQHFSIINFEIKSSRSIGFPKLELAMNKVMEEFRDELRPDSTALKVVEIKEDLILYRFSFGLKKYNHERVSIIKQMLYRSLLSILEDTKK